ncbi:MAG TPA: DUF1667 domain-containing protein [Candidatus Mediterraneibacter vanvlietii]|nr:DUF1667 domain-containing protein [Candidatus Mediterraneibacter vanvlietii]
MESKTLTCICCPMGCQITVETNGSEIINLTGNTCKRGDTYARREITSPSRTVTSTVRVTGGTLPAVSVKTRSDIPKDKIFECIRCLKDVSVKAPVHIGEVILSNAAGTGVDIIATKNVEAQK